MFSGINIKSEAEYEQALERIEQIMEAETGTPEGDELELLSLLVQNYEESNFPLPDPDTINAIQYFNEQRGVNSGQF